MKHTPVARNVLAVLWLARSAGRKQLSGLLRYISECHPWNLRLISDPRDLTEDLIRQCERDAYSGFIGHASAEAAQILAQWDVPAVLIDYPPPVMAKYPHSYTLVLDDDERIGALAAAHFRSFGKFATFAYVPDTENRGWSRLRERGFRIAVERFGERPVSFRSSDGHLADWLKRLPKPAAVLSSHDFRAIDVLGACRQARISVPRDVCVLGVDNDEIVCDYATPSLSSVRIDHEHIGYLAAAELDKRMKRRKQPLSAKKTLVPPVDIVERGSTHYVSPVTALVARMTRYIDGHVTEPISTKDVVDHVSVSRSLADLRFRQLTGVSIRKAIENRRLELVCRRLKTTEQSITHISRLCGFPNVQRLKYVFKAKFGVSMSEFRRTRSQS